MAAGTGLSPYNSVCGSRRERGMKGEELRTTAALLHVSKNANENIGKPC